MKLTDKRFWNLRILIVLLITAFLIAIVVLFKGTLTTDTEKNRGKERTTIQGSIPII